MNKYRKHIDQFFREKLGNYRETPPPDVWDDLEQRLDGLAAAPKPSAPGKWMWHVAIVSVILFMGVSAVKKYYTAGSNTNKPMAANESATSNTPVSRSTASTTTAAAQSATNATNNVTAATTSQPTASGNNDNSNGNSINNNNNPKTNSATAQLLPSNSISNHQNPSTNKATASHNHRYYAAAAHNRTSGKTNANRNAYASNTYNTAIARNSHNNKLSNPAPEEETTEGGANASPNTTLSVVDNKPKDSKNPTQAITENKKPSAVNNLKKNKPSFARIEAGIKTGFEGGFTSDAATKFVVSPYLQYNLSPKIAVMVQPAVKAANLRSHDLGSPISYYQANNETSVLTMQITPSVNVKGPVRDTVGYTTKYSFSQTHDSIVKSNKTTARVAMEYELPVLFKYNVSKKVAVYGGVNIVCQKLVGITENTFVARNISRSIDTTIYTTTAPQPGFAMSYDGTPYKNYSGPMQPAQTGYQFNVGYMVGFTYTCHEKWLFDALIQQAPAKQDVKSGYNINTPLSSTYLRLSIGYKLTK